MSLSKVTHHGGFPDSMSCRHLSVPNECQWSPTPGVQALPLALSGPFRMALIMKFHPEKQEGWQWKRWRTWRAIDRRLTSICLVRVKWHVSEGPDRRMHFHSVQKEGKANHGLLIHYKHQLKSLHYSIHNTVVRWVFMRRWSGSLIWSSALDWAERSIWKQVFSRTFWKPELSGCEGTCPGVWTLWLLLATRKGV